MRTPVAMMVAAAVAMAKIRVIALA